MYHQKIKVYMLGGTYIENQYMSTASEDLKAAVDQIVSVATSGFSSISSALEELSSDLKNLTNNSEIETEVSRLTAVAGAIQEQSAGFEKAIRDAVPTVEAPAETPAPVETPAETPAVEEAPASETPVSETPVEEVPSEAPATEGGETPIPVVEGDTPPVV
jgi:hypothetical protein